MPQISLATYTIRIREKRQAEYFQLDTCEPIGDFFDFLGRYFGRLEEGLVRDERSKKLIKLESLERDEEGRSFHGLIETGEWGYEAELVDSKEGNLKYHREIDDAEMLPFYFFVNIPEGKDEGILILQRFGIYGMTTAFQKSLASYLDLESNELLIEINPLIPEGLIEQYLNHGEYTKVVLRKFSIPSDIANYYDTQDHKEVKGYAEFRLIASHGDSFPFKKSVKKYLSHERDKLIEIQNFDYDSASIEVKLNDMTRTINLSDMSKFRPYFDVTSQVELKESGHPDYESINNIAKALFNDIKESITPNL